MSPSPSSAVLDRLCADFARQIQRNSAQPLESFLPLAPDDQQGELFRRLIGIEVEQRQRAGNPLAPDEARSRFVALGDWVSSVLREYGLHEFTPAVVLDAVAGPFQGRSYRMAGHSTFVVGRGPAGVHLALTDDQAVSRLHFLIESNPPQIRLADLQSKNGTFVNGYKVQQIELNADDEIRVGLTTLKVRLVNYATRPPSAASPSAVPRIPGYSLETELGRGGMGVVHQARRLVDGQLVAIKVLAGEIAEPEKIARFHREIAILQQLRHPHIVPYLDSGLACGVLWLAMELVPGPNAAALIKSSGPFAFTRTCEIGYQLLDALAYAHAQGIVHRDVKPSNLLLSHHAGKEVIKLADFGLARAYQASILGGLTPARTPGGTPDFMPPEQVLDFRSANPQADQYAAAATLYYLLKGETIYEPAVSTLNLFWRIMTSEPIPLRKNADAGAFAAVLRKALARNPAQRFSDAKTMRAALLAATSSRDGSRQA